MRYLQIFFLLCISFFGAHAAAEENYPARPVKIIVPFPPGGTIDVVMRPLGNAMALQLGQPIIIDNRAGANGLIGTAAVAKSAPDGYTLLAVTASFALNPSMYSKLDYDAIKDFAPVTAIMQGAGFAVIAHPSVPASNMKELVALGRKSGVPLAYSSPGVGNTIHIASELFNQHAGTNFMHVPYKGSAPSLSAVLAGEVQLAIMPPGIVMPHIKSGKLKVLGFTGRSRLPELPDVPTMAESGVGNFVFEGTWIGLFAPAGTPKPIVNRLQAEVRNALAQPVVREAIRRNATGYLADGGSPEEFGKQVRDDVVRYADILRKLDIKPE
jgi:tripartite-type tricarboxylate transporter receptor subunit TctC